MKQFIENNRDNTIYTTTVFSNSTFERLYKSPNNKKLSKN